MLCSLRVSSCVSRHSGLTVFKQNFRVRSSGARITTMASSKVSVAEASKMLASGSHSYLDVRTPAEFAAGHAPGAVNVPIMLNTDAGMTPNPGFLETVQSQFQDKSKALLVGCKAGPRSGRACGVLGEAGYTNLADVEGGWMAWAAAGLPTA